MGGDAGVGGAAARFGPDGGPPSVNAANLNSLDRGGNVSLSSGGGLFIDVSACTVVKPGNAGMLSYAGSTGNAVGANANPAYVYLDGNGALVVNTSGFPADQRTSTSGSTPSGYIPLATVVTSGSVVTAINDKRPAFSLPGDITLPDPGTGIAIPVSGYKRANLAFVIGAGAETSSVAAAQEMGQELHLGVASTGGGTRTVTLPSVFDATGNHTHIAFTATTQSAIFRADAALNWVLVANMRSANGAVAVLS